MLIKLKGKKLYLLVHEERDISFDLELFPSGYPRWWLGNQDDAMECVAKWVGLQEDERLLCKNLVSIRSTTRGNMLDLQKEEFRLDPNTLCTGTQLNRCTREAK